MVCPIGTIEALNTRSSDQHDRLGVSETMIEQIKAKLKVTHDETVSPKDFIFSIDWLEKLVDCR